MTTIDDVDDIEGKVRDLGRTVIAPPLPGATAVMARGRRRRRHRRGRLAAIVVVAGTGGALGAQALRSGSGGPTVQVTTADPADDGSGATSPAPPPTTAAPPSTTTPTDITLSFVAIPNVIGLENKQAVGVLEDLGFRVQVRGDNPEGAVVVAQEPAPEVTVPPGSDIVLDVG